MNSNVPCTQIAEFPEYNRNEDYKSNCFHLAILSLKNIINENMQNDKRIDSIVFYKKELLKAPLVALIYGNRNRFFRQIDNMVTLI
jgi:hypothetical protein